MNSESDNAKIDEYLGRSEKLNGQIISEREQWNYFASADAIRHFAYGIGDDNPLWLDHNYASKSYYKSLVAPPSFLTSVLYPGLHGFPMVAPLSSLISELNFEWYRPLLEGNVFRACAKQLDVKESMNRKGRRLIYVLSEITYSNERGEVVGKANSTMARVHHANSELLLDRDIYEYSGDELQEIKSALRAERRTGERVLSPDELRVGFELPVLIRGPLTIGDLISWQAAIGPSYRAAVLAFRDGENAPHTTAIHPITGWPYKYSQQHEDHLLSKQRGMPAPFDNTVMRFAWVSSLLTNWMGDHGFLRSLSINAIEPVLYGDTNWYRGEISDVVESDLCRIVKVKITGTNQINQITTDGLAEVAIPLHPHHNQGIFIQPKAIQSDVVKVDSFHSVFAFRVQQHIDKRAVVCGAHSLSYRELDERVNLLCLYLNQKNIGPGSRVGVLLGRSVDAIMAILAVIKTGAVYVPLDSEYPKQALLRMIEEAEVEFFLTHTNLRQHLPASKPQVICLDQRWESGVYDSNKKQETVIDSNDIAYVMFTSGTTGAPKAVAVTYGSLNLYLESISDELDISHEDVYLNSASFSFSASTRQTFLPLYCGCTVILADEEQRRNQHALLSVIKKQNVSVWDTIPTSIRFCTEYLEQAPTETCLDLFPTELRLILTTGEPLPWDIPHTWLTRFTKDARFVNLYSQTETSGTVCIFEIPRSFELKNGYVPLGSPIKNTCAYILDQSMNPVPRGEVGELYIGGDRVALGYINDPRLSGETFVLDPFTLDINSRLYRTGDLAYKLPDGDIQTMGRSDTRVKFNGYRVELTAIETSLATHSAIQEVAVVVSEDASRENYLVGYVVPKKNSNFTTRMLRGFLKDKLPMYMIPSVFVEMEKLPVTENGKLDRGFLSSLKGFRKHIHGSENAAPSSEIERELLTIWKQVMGLESLGIDNDFFELGGHSLQATQISSRIYERLGESINLNDLFRHSTIRILAVYLINRS